jgi:hypothetical protein
MKKSKKASSRVTAPNQKRPSRPQPPRRPLGEAARSNAVENVAKRQFQKSQAPAIQGHMQVSGQRRQAKRDAR